MAVAHQLIPRTSNSNVIDVPDAEAVRVASVILGLWLFVHESIPDLSYYVARWLSVGRDHSSNLGADPDFGFVVMARFGIQLAVAIALIFKAKTISRYLINKSS